MFRKIFCTLLLMILFCCGCAKKERVNDDFSTILERDQLIVGVREDTRPFGFKNNDGTLAGYDVELAKIFAKYLLGNENKVRFVPVTAANRMMKLGAKEVDILVATMSITPQRQQIIDFSVPYYIAGQAILVSKNSDINSLKGFNGRKLIIVYGSTSERNIKTNIPDVKIIGYKTYTEAYKALKEGKADGMLADDTVLMGFSLTDNSVKILPQRYSQEPYAVAFRKGEESLKLQNKVNTILDNLQYSGELFRMQEKWGIKN